MHSTDDKIRNYLIENFPSIYKFRFSGKVYLCGGAVKDIILDRKPKDLDFVVYKGDSKESIAECIHKHGFETRKNSFGDIKIVVRNSSLTVDIWTIDEYSQAVEYNLDGLFYDISDQSFVSAGFISGLDDGLIKTPSMTMCEKRSLKRADKLKECLAERDRLLKYLNKSRCKYLDT